MLSSCKSCIIRGTLSSAVSVNECLILLWYVNIAQIFCQKQKGSNSGASNPRMWWSEKGCITRHEPSCASCFSVVLPAVSRNLFQVGYSTMKGTLGKLVRILGHKSTYSWFLQRSWQVSKCYLLLTSHGMLAPCWKGGMSGWVAGRTRPSSHVPLKWRWQISVPYSSHWFSVHLPLILSCPSYVEFGW